MPEKSIRDALKLAQKDAAFATDLVKNPKNYAEEYNLTSAHITSLSKGKRLMTAALKAGKLPSASEFKAAAGGGPYG